MHTRLIGVEKAADASQSQQEVTGALESEAGAAGIFSEGSPELTASELNTIRYSGNTLPIGTLIHEFKITDLIAIGGFGIVYLAEDLSLGRYVALKEYMPTSLAERTHGITVAVKSQHHTDTFNAGLRSFINEARLLAQFDHPSLVKVFRFWEENGTAYMVMPYLEGVTLQKALAAMPSPPDESWLKELLAQLLDALEIIHRDHCFHRDISPDNILMLKNGRPLLLDFGAARRIIGDRNQALTVILKPSYAPPEQYAESPEVQQGAWTDIYALGAVIYCAITGKPPTPSISRVINDTLLPLAQTAAGRYSAGFLRAIDQALAIAPENRPQSVAEWRNALFSNNAEPSVDVKETSFMAQKKMTSGKIAAAGFLLLALAAVAYFVLNRSPLGGSGPTLSVEKSILNAEKEVKALDATNGLDWVFEQRDPTRTVSVTSDPSTVKIGRDKLHFHVNSAQSGYLYILMVGTDRSHFTLLFPNEIDKNNRVTGGKELGLPRSGWSMTAGGPAGTNRFVAIVSENPRDFLAAGWVTGDPFAEFPPELAAKITGTTADHAAYAGKTVCPSSGNCSNDYGAAAFLIQEVD